MPPKPKFTRDEIVQAAMRRFESYAEQKLPGLPRKDADADPGGYRSGKLSAVLPEVPADVPDLQTGSENRISLSARR